MVIFPVYSYLLTPDENAEVVGDLATNWQSSPDGLTWTFEIADNAYFINRTNPYSQEHQVTIDDVIYSYWLIQNYSSNLHFYLPGEIDGYEPTIESMTPIGDYKMELVLSGPYAPFYNAIQSIPIFPQYWWEPRVAAAGDDPGMVDVEDDPEGGFPIGSGPFYYDHDGLSPTETEFVMKRNPTWFQEDVRGWQLNVDQMRLKECTDAGTAWLELKAGTIDFFMEVPPTIFINDLPGTPNVIGCAQNTGYVYEFNLNQMSDELRAQLGGSFNKGTNSQLLQDPVIKEAMAMCVNKSGFISQVLLGLGTVADSLIPDVNPWHYTYGTAPGEIPIPFDTAGAREMLWNDGWKYNAVGVEVPVDSDQCPLYGYFDDVLTPLEFRFTTPQMSEYVTGALLIKTWAAEAGFKLNLEAKSSSEMNSDWYSADYDIWLWNWIFSPVSDPSTDVLSVMTTQEIGTWSDCFWSNSTYDALYNESLVEMDVDLRRGIVNEMQAMLYEDAACQCVAYRDSLYAASLRNWQNYGNLEEHFMLLPDMTPMWLCMRICPTDNWAPVVEVDPCFEGNAGESTAVSATIWDDDPLTDLEYRWFWGDGNSTDWIPGDSGESSHSYSEAGEYTAYVAAREASSSNGYDDYFITSNKTTVIVYDSVVSYDLNLEAGWNLVSIPLLNHSYNASELGLDFLDSVSRWDPTTQMYDKGYLVGVSLPEQDFELEPSWAYWIYSGTAKTLTLYGDEPVGEQVRLITVPPGGGWVQVGLASLQTDFWASDIVDMYSGSVSSISRWNAITHMYDSYLVVTGLFDFQLSPGDGLWAYVEMSGILSYEAS
ncbi:MAG: hypothetical protein JSU93_02500 [Methanobacteriota archaeon]|nr:MAG: hypothetical protein JSU93_02500 [Euryarchaeota archaeon]